VATIEQTDQSVRVNRNRIALALLGVVAIALLAVVVWSLWPVPQMGTDEEVFRTVDALFTAVTARDEKLLGQCEQRLHAYRDSGKLPKHAARYLDGVIAKARAGSWQTAAERLYDFMKSQRREGSHPPTPKQHTAKPTKKK
jgi:hypothetical protein